MGFLFSLFEGNAMLNVEHLIYVTKHFGSGWHVLCLDFWLTVLLKLKDDEFVLSFVDTLHQSWPFNLWILSTTHAQAAEIHVFPEPRVGIASKMST